MAYHSVSNKIAGKTEAKDGGPRPTSFCRLPTAHCPLPTAYCLLPTHCLLPTAYCPRYLPMSEERSYEPLCGWRGADATQQHVARQFPPLRQAAPRLFAAPPPTSPILLYKAWQEVLGKYPAYPAQEIGDCVSFGHGHGNDLLQCIESRLGAPVDYRETDTEFIYAASREVAGILGTSDGSYGSAAVKAMTTIGMVSREMLGSDSTYSGERAKAWGRTGPPHDLELKAAPYKLGSAALVSSWSDLVAAITNGYPVTICTSLGFKLTRDANGFCAPSGTWGHCMLIAGVRFDLPGACIVQSWGPDTPDGPTVLDQPDFSFWAEQSAIEQILGEGDSWALAKTPAFVTRELPSTWKYDSAA